MKNKVILFSAAWSVSVLALACASDSHSEQVRDARLEKVEEQATAQEDALDERADAQQEQLEKAHEKHGEDIEGTSGEAAAQDLNELSLDRSEYQVEAKTRVDKLAVRIQESEQKLSVLGAQAPSTLSTDLDGAQREHAMLKQEVSELGTTPNEEWGAAKARLERDIGDLTARLETLQDKIDDVT